MISEFGHTINHPLASVGVTAEGHLISFETNKSDIYYRLGLLLQLESIETSLGVDIPLIEDKIQLNA